MKSFVIAVLMILSAPCFNGEILGKDNKSPEIQAQEAMTKQAQAWNKGDLDGYMNAYWKSDSLVFIGKSIQRGWDSVNSSYQKLYSDKSKRGTLNFTYLKTTTFTENDVMIVGRWEVTIYEAKRGGNFTVIMKKINNEWKVVYNHTS